MIGGGDGKERAGRGHLFEYYPLFVLFCYLITPLCNGAALVDRMGCDKSYIYHTRAEALNGCMHAYERGALGTYSMIPVEFRLGWGSQRFGKENGLLFFSG